MPDLPCLLILALATWRLSSLLACEDGPADILVKLRLRLGVKYDKESKPYGTNGLAKGIICVWCSSIWIGAAWALLWYAWPQSAPWLALPFALSAGAALVEKYAR